MFLIDSNIIIYSHLPQYKHLRNLFIEESIFVSEISRVEVLGYYKLTIEEKDYFEDVFNLLPIILPSQQIFDEAISLRKGFNLKLGDSIIAATALVHSLTIYTRNTDDFKNVSNLMCINPVV